MRRFLIAISTSLGLIASPVTAETVDEAASTEACEGCGALLELAAASPARKDDSGRDKFRHPIETLSFFGVRPDMKVGEYAPGGGWYTRMLAPYLAGEGELVGLFYDSGATGIPERYRKGVPDQVTKFPENAAGSLAKPGAKVAAFSLDAVPDGQAGTFDRILVMRMMHNMMRWGIAASELKTMATLLKDDGMLGIVQHRAKADAPDDYVDGSKGYLREADVIDFVEAQGFDFVGKSEVNANPKDTADYESGVWTLPPSLAKKDEDKARYEAIGESDRMTLLFRKAS
ncbi:methyltransferase [Novosphingobium sp. PC22D]|uniref:class I SAM-dependent methyltransferase n=1 Tax=Novosphingobium sp. PC22D TaxID=1962403 RepID=UPI000BF13A47|nr:class I SAM-dependent methyltransferase [Novosphingobium sp. PC22D]PEQ12037.1 methyltransferase [Novosphingobium sp. PC22D]